MPPYKERKEVVKQLDFLIYSVFVYVFFLDGHTVSLVFKCISQVQFSNPAHIHPNRSLRFFVFFLLFVHLMTVWGHMLDPVGRKSIVLDFVGQANPPSRLHLILIDLVAGFLQFILVVTAYSTSPRSVEGYESDDGDEEDNVAYDLLATSDCDSEDDEAKLEEGAAAEDQRWRGEDDEGGDGEHSMLSSTLPRTLHRTQMTVDRPLLSIRFVPLLRTVFFPSSANRSRRRRQSGSVPSSPFPATTDGVDEAASTAAGGGRSMGDILQQLLRPLAPPRVQRRWTRRRAAAALADRGGRFEGDGEDGDVGHRRSEDDGGDGDVDLTTARERRAARAADAAETRIAEESWAASSGF